MKKKLFCMFLSIVFMFQVGSVFAIEPEIIHNETINIESTDTEVVEIKEADLESEEIENFEITEDIQDKEITQINEISENSETETDFDESITLNSLASTITEEVVEINSIDNQTSNDETNDSSNDTTSENPSYNSTTQEISISIPTIAPGDSWYYKTSINKFNIKEVLAAKSNIEKINIVDSYTVTGDETDSWPAAVDANNDGTLDNDIMCYLNGAELTIAGNGSGKIKANADSSEMFYLFINATEINGLDMLDTSDVNDMGFMFANCVKLTSLDLSNFDTSKVTDMSYMFSRGDKLTSLNVSSFDTSNVTDMNYMFNYCLSLTSLDVSNFDTSKVTDMGDMFKECIQLRTLDLSSFDTSNVTNMDTMFMNCSKLTTIHTSDKFVVNKVIVIDGTGMFYGCSCLAGENVNKINAIIKVNNGMLGGIEMEDDNEDYTFVESNNSGGSIGGGGSSAKEDIVNENTDEVAIINDDLVEIIESTVVESNSEDTEVTFFADLDSHVWAKEAINNLTKNGVIKGVTETNFAPEKNITRADFAILIVRAFDLISDEDENFVDVHEDDYFAKELAVARNNGIILGNDNNEYNPSETISRQDMMVIVNRVLDKIDVHLESSDIEYNDFNEVAEYAQNAVEALVANKLIEGNNGMIKPKDTATRAEVAVFLNRVISYVENNK